jgi:molecular chaperone HtpG
MVMLEDEAARLKKSIDSDEADKRIGSVALMLARKFTKKIDDKVERHLYLNMQSQLIQILLELPEHKAAQYARLIRGYVFAIVGSSDRQAFSQSISQYFNDLTLLLTNKED